jgi:hypothetical protein
MGWTGEGWRAGGLEGWRAGGLEAGEEEGGLVGKGGELSGDDAAHVPAEPGVTRMLRPP